MSLVMINGPLCYFANSPIPSITREKSLPLSQGRQFFFSFSFKKNQDQLIIEFFFFNYWGW